MGRPRKQIDELQFAEMVRRGCTEEAIAQALGCGHTTVSRLKGRIMREAAERARLSSAPARGTHDAFSLTLPEDLPPTPEAIPNDAPAELIDKWIHRIDKLGDAAEASGDLGVVASLSQRMVALQEHRRKAMPMPVIDPNTRPDMLAAKERARAAFYKLHDAICNRTKPR